MKTRAFVLHLLPTLGLFLAASITHAADIALTDGRVFRDASVLSQTPRTVVIKHADGLSGVAKTLLPAELAARYPLDEAAAREADRQSAEARARADAFHRAEALRAAQLRADREETALLNARTAALEAAERLANAEAARIAAERSAVRYDYVPVHRPHRYVYPSFNVSQPRCDFRDDHRPSRAHDFAHRHPPRRQGDRTHFDRRHGDRAHISRAQEALNRMPKPSAALARP